METPELTPVLLRKEVEVHSRPASILVNLPITNTINEQESIQDEMTHANDLEIYSNITELNPTLLRQKSVSHGRSTETMMILDCENDWRMILLIPKEYW